MRDTQDMDHAMLQEEQLYLAQHFDWATVPRKPATAQPAPLRLDMRFQRLTQQLSHSHPNSPASSQRCLSKHYIKLHV